MENRQFGKSALWWLPALLLAAFMVAALPGIARADYEWSTDGNFMLNTETGLIENVNREVVNAVIPSTIAGHTVKGISGSAFSWNQKVKSVTLPSSIKTIPDGAFDGCTSLTTIKMPGVTVIEDRALGTAL